MRQPRPGEAHEDFDPQADTAAPAAAADREEKDARAAVARFGRDYQRGAITAEQWQELAPEAEEGVAEASNRAGPAACPR
jgi:hypothetical protein